MIEVFSIPSTISAEETRIVDRNSEYLGVSTLQLMENAGKAIADAVSSRFKATGSVVVFAGTGRNGGDGLVAARHLANRGFKVTVLLIGDPNAIRDDSARKNWLAASRMRDSVRFEIFADSSAVKSRKCDVALDALLGTGARGELREPIATAVRVLNRMECFRVAVDVPTGVDSDTGETAPEAVRANLTVTFHAKKMGFDRAKSYLGEVVIADIGIPREAWFYAGPGDVEVVTSVRSPDAHKGDFGRLLVIGGSETFSGAPALAGLAALRTGVDLVFVAAPEKTAHDIAAFSPNLITLKLQGDCLQVSSLRQLHEHILKASGLVVGPGLGMERRTFAAVRKIVQLAGKVAKPCLIDADALKGLGKISRPIGVKGVLTPHAGEFKIIHGSQPDSDRSKRARQAVELAQRSGCTVLLKGRVDVIADNERVKLNWTGNPGMTVGGTGDVLSGIVGGLLAQGIEPFRAATAGAFINGAAGDLAAKEYGHHLAPSDLLPLIPHVMNDPMAAIRQ